MIQIQAGMPALYHPHQSDHLFSQGGALAATVVHVWRDREVNLVVYDRSGMLLTRTGVALWMPGDGEPPPKAGHWCQLPDWFAALVQPRRCLHCEPIGAPRPAPSIGQLQLPVSSPALLASMAASAAQSASHSAMAARSSCESARSWAGSCPLCGGGHSPEGSCPVQPTSQVLG